MPTNATTSNAAAVTVRQWLALTVPEVSSGRNRRRAKRHAISPRPAPDPVAARTATEGARKHDPEGPGGPIAEVGGGSLTEIHLVLTFVVMDLEWIVAIPRSDHRRPEGWARLAQRIVQENRKDRSLPD